MSVEQSCQGWNRVHGIVSIFPGEVLSILAFGGSTLEANYPRPFSNIHHAGYRGGGYLPDLTNQITSSKPPIVTAEKPHTRSNLS